MVRMQTRSRFESWALQIFVGVSVVLVSLLVADSLGLLDHGAVPRAVDLRAAAGDTGRIRPADTGAFDSGKFSTKKAWFYHRVGESRGAGPSLGDGGGGQ